MMKFRLVLQIDNHLLPFVGDQDGKNGKITSGFERNSGFTRDARMERLEAENRETTGSCRTRPQIKAKTVKPRGACSPRFCINLKKYLPNVRFES